jgi:hypothetical protein
MSLTLEEKILIGGALVVGGYIFLRGFGGVAKDVTKAAVDTAGGVVAGVAVGVGDMVGLPETNVDLCELAISKGEYMSASIHCGAPRFIKFLATGK